MGEFEGFQGELIILRVGTKSYAFPLARLIASDQAYARHLVAGNPIESLAKNNLRPTSDWPRWRGPNGNGVSRETGLLKQWPSRGPPLLWTTNNLGKGYSSVIVVGDRIYTLGLAGGGTSIFAINIYFQSGTGSSRMICGSWH